MAASSSSTTMAISWNQLNLGQRHQISSLLRRDCEVSFYICNTSSMEYVSLSILFKNRQVRKFMHVPLNEQLNLIHTAFHLRTKCISVYVCPFTPSSVQEYLRDNFGETLSVNRFSRCACVVERETLCPTPVDSSSHWRNLQSHYFRKFLTYEHVQLVSPTARPPTPPTRSPSPTNP